ncbi:hypothetical protein HDU79_009891 [Rhizoclosmatium sp. JEL0117]|nr:hypothetical protein HDU79_009891 [Rhizoclosmatium sp. JEL0117]
MGIGPQLPPGFPRPKSQEEEEEEEGYSGAGPQLPPGFSKPSAPAGPQLPPGFQRKQAATSNNNIDEDIEGPTVAGPSLPPGFRQKSGPSLPSETSTSSSSLGNQETSKKRRVMGPAAPPPPTSSKSYPGEEEDDDFGPMPVPQEYSEYLNQLELERTRLEIESRVAKAASEASGASSSAAPTRGAWMTVPPEAKKLNQVLGTELKHRQFSRSEKQEVVDQSGWTRLPGEKGSEVEGPTKGGVKRKQEYVDVMAPSQADMEARRAVEEYNRANRPKSLMEMHTTEYVASNKFAENDASARKFDRDRDLSSRRTDGKARQNLIDGAAKLDTRFSKGDKSYL